MTYRFEWVLQDIRDGVQLPERWPEQSEQDEQSNGHVSMRWWEEEGLSLEDFPELEGRG